jgi:hypothetical protein
MTTTPEQIEAVARAMWLSQYPSLTWELDANSTAKIEFRVLALAAINTMRPFIRAEALEEAAKMCEECPLYDEDGVDWNTDPQVTLAAAIRALKEKKDV